MGNVDRISEDLTKSLSNLTDARQQTRALAKSHYENFLVASVLLPRRIRQPFYDVYAFCRIADDLADESASPEVATVRLIELRGYLRSSFAGTPTSNLFLALHQTATEFGLSQQPFEDLLDAFDQDQVKFRYETMEDLLGYCRNSANPVGRIVLQLGDCLNDHNIDLSDQICTGLQLANHWQDVARDFRIGRIYLPMEDWKKFAVDESMFCEPDAVEPSRTPLPLRQLIAYHCDVAEQYLRNGLPLADNVPRWLAADIRLFAHGGLKTIAAIRAIDHDVLATRPKVGKWTQGSLVLRAMLGWL